MRYWILALTLLLSLPTTSHAQEATPEATPETEPEISLTPFSLAAPRISGLHPVGWDEFQPGTYIRNDGLNLTYLLHLSTPGAESDDVLPQLLESIVQAALPDEFQAFSGETFDWEVYQMSYTPVGFDQELAVLLALAETDAALHIILLQTTPEESMALQETVFIPALQAYGLPLPQIYERLGLAPLEAVTITEFDVHTAVPVGWEEVNPGSFLRASFQGDITTLLVQTSPDLSAEAFGLLLLERLGIGAALPEEPDTVQAEDLTWSLYTLEVRSQGQRLIFYVALAEDGQYAYLVVLLSTAEEAETLRETIMVPVLRTTNRASAAPES